MGADRAILVEHEQDLEPLNIAKLLKNLVNQEKPELIILGKTVHRWRYNQTGQMLAALMDYPQATFASNIELQEANVIVTREIDGGLETIRLNLPAIITTDLRLNEPRYVVLPNIIKARKKQLDIVAANSLGVDLKEHLRILKVESPQVRKGGQKVNSVAELIDQLKNKEGVI